jgi:hypothetical protein
MPVYEFSRLIEPEAQPGLEQLTAQRARLADFDMPESPKDALERHTPDFGALVQPRSLLEMVGQMRLGEHARLEFHRGEKGWSFELVALNASIGVEADDSGFEALLSALAPKARFSRQASSPKVCASVVRLAPRPTTLDAAGEKPLWLPPLGRAESDLTLALRLAFDLPVETLAFDVRPMILTETQRSQLAAAGYRLADKAVTPQSNEAAHAFIARWLGAGQGCSIAVEIASARELTDQELNALSLALFGCVRHVGAPQGLDLRLALPRGVLPLWRFWPTAADLCRYDRLDLDVPAGNGALTLGVDSAGQSVRLAPRDRPYHVFVCGVTGSGKSTSIGNACREDIENGEGVLLIDPHGDLARRVRAAIPPGRRRDLIWIDLGDKDLAWRLDLFDTPGIFPDAERDRIASQLIAYFRQIYAGAPEAFGPLFDNLFRGTILLLHSAKDEADRTLLKIRKVLVDSDFRDKLLEECEDEDVIELWREIQRVRGDWELENIAPYITCKLNHLTGPMMRRFIGGDKPRLDLRQAMDERRIVIVNLNKAAMSDLGARLAGALVLMALNEAAMGRSLVPEEQRVPFRVYCDEFQTMACDQAAAALAECRKFNIALLLANQNLGQLRGDWYSPTDVSQTVLANCNSLIALRCGLHDAKLLAPLLGLEDHRELVDLGVGEMIVRRLVNGFPAPAQRIYGLPPAPPPSQDASANDP